MAVLTNRDGGGGGVQIKPNLTFFVDQKKSLSGLFQSPNHWARGCKGAAPEKAVPFCIIMGT